LEQTYFLLDLPNLEEKNYNGYEIYRFGNLFYGIQPIDNFELNFNTLERDENFLSANSITGIKKKIDEIISPQEVSISEKEPPVLEEPPSLTTPKKNIEQEEQIKVNLKS